MTIAFLNQMTLAFLKTQLATELVQLGRRNQAALPASDDDAVSAVLDTQLSMRMSNDMDDPSSDLHNLQQHNIARNFVVRHVGGGGSSLSCIIVHCVSLHFWCALHCCVMYQYALQHNTRCTCTTPQSNPTMPFAASRPPYSAATHPSHNPLQFWLPGLCSRVPLPRGLPSPGIHV